MKLMLMHVLAEYVYVSDAWKNMGWHIARNKYL